MEEKKQIELKDIAAKVKLTAKEFAEVSQVSTSALNQLKSSPVSVKYEITTLGIMAKYLNLSYDDLVMISNIKKSVADDLQKKENLK